MEIFDSIGGFISGINFTLIFQLTCLALIVVSGPIVIFLLSARGGDL
ncbi:MAG: photosystem II reaction center protein Ycf12 [Oscillatoriales cyanobacterium SM2_2_1]|nr:photosystem II reaction center protein Ycf12 [Oscillatoriales cyanobacterium SM2_2_1]